MNGFTNLNTQNLNRRAIIISTHNPEIRKSYIESLAQQLLGTINTINHPDFLTLKTEGNSIGIDEVKSLIGKLQYKPYKAKLKVAVVENAEKLTTEAQNAFLKTLEDIPGRTVIILSAANYSNLLPTIISRCIVYEASSKEEIEEKHDPEELLKNSLAEKFKTVETIINMKNPAHKKESASILIKQLVEFFRMKLREDPGNKDYSENLKLLQNTMTSISKNVNLRLALENLMINLTDSRGV